MPASPTTFLSHLPPCVPLSPIPPTRRRSGTARWRCCSTSCATTAAPSRSRSGCASSTACCCPSSTTCAPRWVHGPGGDPWVAVEGWGTGTCHLCCCPSSTTCAPRWVRGAGGDPWVAGEGWGAGTCPLRSCCPSSTTCAARWVHGAGGDPWVAGEGWGAGMCSVCGCPSSTCGASGPGGDPRVAEGWGAACAAAHLRPRAGGGWWAREHDERHEA